MIITCVGDCGVDYYIDHKLLRPGGITLNFAVHARRIFPKKDTIEVISAIGDDPQASVVEKVIDEYKIVPYITHLHGKTPVQQIDHDTRGEKIFVKYEEGVLENFTINNREKRIIEKSDFVMTIIYSQIERFFDSVISCRPKGLMAVDFMDLADYGKSSDIVKKYIDHLDIGFFGLRSHENKLIESLKNIAYKYQKLFVITLGQDGSMATNGKASYLQKAFPVKKVVDTTGAGDAFAAAFIKEYLSTKDINQSLIAGNKQAAIVVAQMGSF